MKHSFTVDRDNSRTLVDNMSYMHSPWYSMNKYVVNGIVDYGICTALYLFSSLCVVVVVQMLPLATSITILQQCAAGMHHLHSLGIIHRDFRAANILVAAERPLHVVVADFGVSHQLRVYAQVCDL